MRRGVSCALLLVLAAGGWCSPRDELKRLESDPSSGASRRLEALYRKATSKDQRFWILNALAARLGRQADVGTLEFLLGACKDRDPELRAMALRSLGVFSALPAQEGRAALGRIEPVLALAEKDRAVIVRAAASELRQRSKRWAEAGPLEGVPPVPPGGSRRRRWPWFIAALALGASLLGPLKRRLRRPRVVRPPKAPSAIGPYSPAVRSGGFIFVSGQIPVDPKTGELAGLDAGAQTRQALRNLGVVLRAAGCGYADVVKTTVYLADMAQFKAMNEAYAEFFTEPHPARSTIGVGTLPCGALVEIEALARER